MTPEPLAPNRSERVYAAATSILLLCVLTAVIRGHTQWDWLPPVVWLHIVAVVSALVLTPVMLLRKRGDRLHRVLGWTWCGLLAIVAVSSFWIRELRSGSLSLIHVLSVWTVIQLPIIIWAARTKNVLRHRKSVHGLIFGALLIAGAFTFPFGRVLGRWLSGQ